MSNAGRTSGSQLQASGPVGTAHVQRSAPGPTFAIRVSASCMNRTEGQWSRIDSRIGWSRDSRASVASLARAPDVSAARRLTVSTRWPAARRSASAPSISIFMLSLLLTCLEAIVARNFAAEAGRHPAERRDVSRWHVPPPASYSERGDVYPRGSGSSADSIGRSADSIDLTGNSERNRGISRESTLSPRIRRT